MKGEKLWLLFVILILPLASASLFYDQGANTRYSNGTLVDGGNLTIYIYDSQSGGNLVWNESFEKAIVNGSWNVKIEPVLEYGIGYWKDYEINGDNMNFSGQDRLEFESSLGKINSVDFINFSLIGSCPEGNFIRQINEDGSVVCESKLISNNSGGLYTNGSAKVEGNIFVGGEINVTENIKTEGNLIVEGDSDFFGDIVTTADGFFRFLGALTFRIQKIFTKDLDFNGTISGDGDINISGNVTASNYFGNGSQLIGVVAETIKDGAVINSKINASSINSTQIIDGAINSEDIGVNQINGSHIVNGVNLRNPNVTGNLTVGGNVYADSFTINGDFVAKGSLVADYLYGQPIDGSIGSGILWASKINKYGNIQIEQINNTLNMSYPSMLVRIMYYNNAIYCNLSNGTVTMPDNSHTVYYLDAACNLNTVPASTYVDSDLYPGGFYDIFNVMVHNGTLKVYSSNPVARVLASKRRKNNLFTAHLDVASGLLISGGTYPNILMSAGKYIYFLDLVDATAVDTSAGDNITFVYNDGSDLVEEEANSFNLTHCDTDSGLSECSNTSLFRRYYVFLTGYSNGHDKTKVNQLASNDSEVYSTLSECVDLQENPVTLSFPEIYKYSVVPLSFYCGKPGDTSWTNGSFVDIRTSGGGGAASTGSSVDTSIFLTKDGSRQLESNWNFGGSDISGTGNMTASYFLGDGSQLTGIVQDNESWNESYANSKYIRQTNESNLNVNYSLISNETSFWAGVSSFILGWLFNDKGELAFNVTKLDERISLTGNDVGFNSTYNSTYDSKSDYQFSNNSFNGTGNFTTAGHVCDSNGCIGDDFTNYSGTIEVAKSGADFTSIQAAIDSITVAPDERYVVVVHPGKYFENVVLKNGVSLSGTSLGAGVEIWSDNGTVLHLGSGNSNVENIKIVSNSTIGGAIVKSTGGLHIISGVEIFANYSNVGGTLVEVSNSVVYLIGGNILRVAHNGDLNGEIIGVNYLGYAISYIESTLFDFSISGNSSDAEVLIIRDNRVGGKLTIQNSDITASLSSANSSGEIEFLKSIGVGDATTLVGNKVELKAINGSGHSEIIKLNTSGLGGMIKSRHNDYIVSGFSENRFTNVASGDNVDSRFDTLDLEGIEKVSDSVAGDGVTNYITSPSDGDIQLSGIVVPVTLSQDEDYGEFENYAFDYMIMNTSSGDKKVTFPNATYLQYFKDGQRVSIFNIGSNDYNIFVNSNGNKIEGVVGTRFIQPGGFIEFQKVQDEIRIVSSKLSGVYSKADDFSNLEFWIDASDNSTLTLSGNNITGITDKANSYLGSVINNSPVLVESAQNGLSVMKFDENNSMLNFGDHELHDNSVGRGMDTFMVVRANQSGNTILAKHQGPSGYEWRIDTNGQYIYELHNNVNEVASYAASVNYNEWTIYETSWSPSGTLKTYINGYLQGNSADSVTDISNTASPIILGADNDYNMNYFGEIAEVIVFSDVLESEDRTNLAESLAAKWGINTVFQSSGSVSYWRRSESTNSLVPENDNDNLDIGLGNMSAEYFFGNGSQLTGIIQDNSSWNESYADSKYINQSSENNLNVNSSTFWSGLSSWLSGWFTKSGTELQFNETKLNATIDAREVVSNETQMILDNNASWVSTYNSTYDTWSYNQTIPAINYTDNELNNYYNKTESQIFNDSILISSKLDYTDQRYNETQMILDNNASWVSTYNSTYDTWSYNQTIPAINYTDNELINYYNKTESQIFNDSLAINSLNSSKIDSLSEGNLNVNSSTFWSGLSSWLSGWFTKSGTELQFNETKLNATIDAREIVSNETQMILNNNASWTTTYNSTYDSWSYNQTIPAINYTDNELNNYYNKTESQIFNDSILISSKLDSLDQRYNETQMILDNNASWTTTYNSTYNSKADYQFNNNSFNGSGNFITSGFVKGDYIYGQPIDGAIESGVISGESFNRYGNLNVSVTPGTTNLTYPGVTVRLVYGVNNNVRYCELPGGTITAPDNQHTVYYVYYADCGLHFTTASAFAVSNLFPGGFYDIFNIMVNDGEVEIYSGAPLSNKITSKARKNNLYTQHLTVAEGLQVKEGTFPDISMSAGKYVYFSDVVDASEQLESSNISFMYSNGNMTEVSSETLNLTYCNNGATLTPCSNSSMFRRYMIFLTGFQNSVDHTKLHELASNDTETYPDIGSCLDTKENPITYELDEEYDFITLPLAVYCGKPSDIAWNGSFIDLRGNNGGSSVLSGGSGIDTSIFLTRDGTRTLSGAWNYGSFGMSGSGDIASTGNVSGAYFIGDGSQLQNLPNGDNSSWNESHADSKYINQNSENNLNVNSSTFWSGLSSWLSGWFTKSGTELQFNETKLNETIDAREVVSNETQMILDNNASWTTTYNSTYDSWSYNQTIPAINYTDNELNNYYNKTESQIFNDSLAINSLNSSKIDSLSEGNLNVNSSTFWSGLSSWLSGWFTKSGTELQFNETKLNATIDARDSDTTYSHLSNFTNDKGYINLSEANVYNETSLINNLNSSKIDSSSEGNLNVNSSVYSNQSTWWSSLSSWISGWFVNNGGQLGFNETKLNETIDAREIVSNETGIINANNASWSSTYNSTYNSKADYQFADNNFNGSGNIETTGNITTSRIDLGNGGYMYDNGTHLILGHS